MTKQIERDERLVAKALAHRDKEHLKFWGEVCWLLNLTTHATEDDIKVAIQHKNQQLCLARATLRTVIDEHCGNCRHSTAENRHTTPGCSHPEFPKENVEFVPQTPCGSWSRHVFWLRGVIRDLEEKEYGCSSPETKGETMTDMWYCPECHLLSFESAEDLNDGNDTCSNCGVTWIVHTRVEALKVEEEREQD